MADIKLIKLTSGEEILATVVSNDNSALSINDAVILVYRKAEGGNMAVGFAPFMPYAEGNITINSTAIASTADCKQDLVDEYNRIFGAGIVIASANDAVLKA